MWYVIGEYAGAVAWWGSYRSEEIANAVAQEVNGTAIKIKDLKAFSNLLNTGRREINDT